AESHGDVLLSCKRGRRLYKWRTILSYIALSETLLARIVPDTIGLALEPLNGGLCRTGVRHLHEAKPTGLTGVPVGNDIDRVHSTIRLEELANVMISRAERKITNKNVHVRILL